MLLKIQKKAKFKTFFGKPFFHRFPTNTCKAVLTTLLKDFRQVTEDFRPSYQKWYTCFSYKKKHFSSKLSTWHVQWSFNKPLKIFPLKNSNCFCSKSVFFLKKTYCSIFSLDTKRKKQFWYPFRTKLPKSEILSLLVWKHDQNKKLSNKLLSQKMYFWRSIRQLQQPRQMVFAKRQKTCSNCQKVRKKLHRRKKFLRFFLWTRRIKISKLYWKLLPKEGNNFARQTKTWALKIFH